MQLEEIKKAKDFLRGDLNIIQWGLKKGYYIISGRRCDKECTKEIKKDEYLLYTLEHPYPNFKHERRINI